MSLWLILDATLLLLCASMYLGTGWSLALFSYNKRMAARITDERELQSVLGKWMFLNWIRVSLWTVQWFAIAGYFAFRLR